MRVSSPYSLRFVVIYSKGLIGLSGLGYKGYRDYRDYRGYRVEGLRV